MEQKLIYINLETNVLQFFSIRIDKKGQMYSLIVSIGKIGNKGVTTIVYEGQDYGYCKNEFWRRVNEKKKGGYRKIDEVCSKINKIFSVKDKYAKSSGKTCDDCGRDIPDALYEKINNYLRNETDVDSNSDGKLYRKVVCIDCQQKHGIYKSKRKVGICDED